MAGSGPSRAPSSSRRAWSGRSFARPRTAPGSRAADCWAPRTASAEGGSTPVGSYRRGAGGTLVEAYDWKGHDLHRSSRAQLDGDLGNGPVVRCLQNVDEVVRAENGVLGDDLATHRLDLFVHLLGTFPVVLQRLAPLVSELGQHDVGLHRGHSFLLIGLVSRRPFPCLSSRAVGSEGSS